MNNSIVTPDTAPISEIKGQDEEGGRKVKTQAATLLDIVRKHHYFHNSEDHTFAHIEVNGHWETHAIESRRFQKVLRTEYFLKTGSPIQERALQEAVEFLSSIATCERESEEVNVRVAYHECNIYNDLGNERWESIKMVPGHWEVVSRPPVKFIRSPGMLELPTPERGGSLDDLRPFVNVKGDNEFLLIVAWMLAALRPQGPYPILIIQGEQGSGKTTLSEVARNLTDPNTVVTRSLSRNEQDLMIAAKNSWVYGVDNLSHLSNEMSDSLCRLATGGGFGTRKLYTGLNDESKVITTDPDEPRLTHREFH